MPSRDPTELLAVDVDVDELNGATAPTLRRAEL
jgi:hypothetical protein